MELRNLSIKCRFFGCFGEEFQGFESIYPINLIVGRNSSGKSTLVDLIEYASTQQLSGNMNHKGNTSQVVIDSKEELGEQRLKRVFNPMVSGGDLNMNHWHYGMSYLGKELRWRHYVGENRSEPLTINGIGISQPSFSYFSTLVQNAPNPISGKTFKRIRAERNMSPEYHTWPISIDSSGDGATNAIRQFITNAELKRSLVEENILKDLNFIFSPDVKFEKITVQELNVGRGGNTNWEIYLTEKNKGNIPLSKSGSGLKTIFLVLINLFLIPNLEGNRLDSCIFAFEELENNLHPALQRNLYTYLKWVSEHKGCTFFFTTHSNVAIDLYGKNPFAQILHVRHNGENSTVEKVSSYIQNVNLLDDLGMRASDLLQANCLVWVEGPSDRIYFNKWIELWTEGKIVEGIHYQCIFYGGRLLSNLSSREPIASPQELVQILRINKNALMLIDSDKKTVRDELNQTKTRLIEEIERIGGIAWVTAGKEVENYLPVEAVRELHGDQEFLPIKRNGSYRNYLNNRISGEGNRFLNNKVDYAKKISPLLRKEDLVSVFDLNQKLESFIEKIKAWNGIL